MDVFVTGGSGYVGRNLIRALVGRGDSVRALARSQGSADVVESVGAQPVHTDVLDRHAMAQGMAGCALVVHAAADTTSGRRPHAAQIRVNAEGTHAVLRAARDVDVPRAVHVSTEAVLADGNPLVRVDESIPIPARHAGSYSETKAMAERIALAENRDGLDVVVVRPRFVWGRDDTTLLPALVAAARRGQFAWIGGGHYPTSTTHVANVVAGILAAAERGRPGGLYFLSDGDPVDFRDFVTRLLATQGVAAPGLSIPRLVVQTVVTAGTLAGMVSGDRIPVPIGSQEYALIGHEVTVDDSLARVEIGYRPVISVAEGLAELENTAS